MAEQYRQQAEWLKTLAHPVRICIVKKLMMKGSCNVTDMQNCLLVQQSTLSMHLQKLRIAGIIEGTRTGSEVLYRLKDPAAAQIVEILLQSEVSALTESHHEA
ncbi:metalloregulator ArsR/SmtB family transcription factor [Paenibacillus sp. KQZ6P-2]|uniref:Metalloregulator ArsR/SmtB family transcription factor n=1 Tax=Paenibacillus mangrovi TaxID=2931978 RepID=A0A9X1WTM1_9BACL|nr:metalloregulator ArsR/SmtB family transcription factor [Paenibacillus mangrovi]MCJ8014783.1 metalloregulator ArsR/SmtB family transcription factor [Paenibacillus mangrovi]